MTTDPLAIPLPDGSFAPAARDMGDGSYAPVCSVDGQAPCCCGGDVACCGTGNQCRLWQTKDAQDNAADPGCLIVPFLETIPHRSRVEGWSLLGVAFDVVQTIQVERVAPAPGCYGLFLSSFAAEFLDRRVRFRLVPGDINPDTPDGQQAIVSAVGPTLHPDGRWQRCGMQIFSYTPRPNGGFDSVLCGEFFVDEGVFNGSVTVDGQTQPLIDASIFDVQAASLPAGVGQTNSIFRAPVDRQAFDQVIGGPIGPLPFDGVVWTGSPYVRGPGQVTDSIRIPIQTAFPCAVRRNFITVERRGGSITRTGNLNFTPITIQTDMTVDHSEAARYVLEETASSTGGGCPWRVTIDASYRLERAGPACPGYADLPANACAPPGFEARIGRRCDDDTAVIPYDTASRPSPASAWPTFLFQGERYTATDEETTVDPVVVEWSQDQCPGPVGEFMLATKCFPPAIPGVAPQEIVVAINPSLGLGAGRVQLVARYPNPSCPEAGDLCTAIVDYRPTTTEHPGPATPGAKHLAGTPCTLPDQVSCRACPVDGEPIDPIRNPNNNPAGNDPMAGFRAAWNCKGCGDAGLEGIL